MATNNVKVKEIYKFYTKSKDLNNMKKLESKKGDKKKSILEEINDDRALYEKHLNFITQYMRWHFRLTDNSFLKNRIKTKTVFFFKRVTVSPDGKMMARLDYDKNLTICRIDENSKITELFTIYDIFVANRNIRFSHKSQKVAFLDIERKEINVWNIQNKLREFVIKEIPNFLTFSKFDDYIGLILEDGLKIFNKDGCLISETKEIKGGGYLDFANLTENKDLVCIVVDQKILVWNFMTKAIIVKYEGEPESNLNSAYFFHNDSKIIAATMNQNILIWDYMLELKKNKSPNNLDLEKKNSVIILREHSGNVLTAIISEDEDYIFSYENKKTLPFAIIWKKDEKEGYKKIDSFAVDFTASSETFADQQVIFLSYDSCIHKYDLKHKDKCFKSENQLGNRKFLSVYSPDHSLLGKFSHNNIYLIDTAKGECSTKIETKITPLAFAFSRNSSRIAIASKEFLSIYEILNENGIKIQQMIKPAKLSTTIDIMRYVNNEKLITGGKTGQILVWNIEGNSLRSDVVAKIHDSAICTISIHPIEEKENFICSGDAKGRFVFWNLRHLQKEGISIETKDNSSEEAPFCINAKFFNKKQKCLVGSSKSRFFVCELPSENGSDNGKNSNETPIQFTIDAWATEDKSKVCLSDFDLSFDDKTVAAIYLDGKIVFWNLERKEIMRTYQFFKYDEKDMENPTTIEIFFQQNSSNSIIIRAKESYKEINLDPEVTELKEVPLIKGATRDRRLISIEKEEGSIKVTNMNTLEQKSFFEKEKQELRSCFLSNDGKSVFAYNLEKYFVWNLDAKEPDLIAKDFNPKLKKDLHVAYPKTHKDQTYVADTTKGAICIWTGKNYNVLNDKVRFWGDITVTIQMMTSFDISRNDDKILIESDNNKLFVFELQNDTKWKKTEANFANVNHNTIFLSKFSAHTDNIYNVMIENYEHKILEWDVKKGEIIHTIPSYSPIQKMMIEPVNDNLFVFTSKEKKNILELFSFKNKVFIQLSDAEDEQPENFFYIPETKELILCFAKKKIKIFHDFYNNSYFIMEKKKKLSKIFVENVPETARKKKDVFVKKNQDSNMSDNSQLIAPYTKIFPFNYNFLQIMAYDQDYHSLESYIFELLKNEKNRDQISFDLFFHRDIHGRNCFDIAFAGKDTRLFKDFLLFIKSNFKISEIQNRYRDYLNSKFFYKMFVMFEDSDIMSDFLNFVFDDPLEFQTGTMSKRMNKPILIKISEPNLPPLKLQEILKKHQAEEKALSKRNEKNNDVVDELVIAKCLYYCEFLDYNIEATREIFKKVGEFEPINPIFESSAIIKLLDYKWHTYAKQEFWREAISFSIFLLIYIINVDFFFISRIETEAGNDTMSSHLIYSISSGVIDCIIFAFVFRLIYHEYKQITYFGFDDYFSSVWNYNDLLYISFSLTSTILDLFSCFDVFTQFDVLKSLQSLTIFFAFFRLMSYARGFEGSSFMIKLIIRVVKDIRYFLILMILFIISLSCSVFVLQSEYSYSIFGTWDIFFREMIGDLGELDDLKEEVVSQWILYIFFALATLILYITMLNLLIAIISDTFSDVKKAEKLTKVWERWNIITEIDMMLSQSEKKSEEKNKGYLMYIYNEKHEKEEKEKKEKEKEKKEKEEEQKELFKLIKDSQSKYQNDYEKLSKEMSSLRQQIQENQTKMSKEMEELKNIMIQKN